MSDNNGFGGRSTQAYDQGGAEGPDAWSPLETDTAGSFNLAEYWRLALKHRILILGVLGLALLIGVAVTLISTPVYTASTTLQIDREAAQVFNTQDRPQEPLIQGEEFFQTQYGLLRSRSLAERVAESEGLVSSDNFLVSMGVTPPARKGTAAAQSTARREIVIETLSKNLRIRPVRGSRLVAIGFSSPDPALSAQIVNAFAQEFIESSLERRFESSAYARTFLEGQLAQTKSKLEEAERQLVAYAAQQQIINVSDGNQEPGSNSQSLASNNLVIINSALAEARTARIAAEQKWRQAQSSSLMNLAEVFQNPTVQRLTEQRAQLGAQYQQNLATYKPDYPLMVQLKSQIDELDRQLNLVASSVRTAIRDQYVVAVNQERALQGQVDRLKSDVLDLRDRSIQYNILQREVDTSRSLYDGLLQRYKEVGVTAGVTTNNVSIVDVAEPPTSPSGPKLLINLLIAGLLGLGFGVVSAFVLEALDESLATPEDVELKLGVPVLGAVPRLEKGETPLAALADVRSGFSEAYYSLRTALQFSTPNGAPASVLVTSSRPAEGKSTTSYALAYSLARLGKRVLLVDGDLRNPSMHRTMDVDNERGMSNVLSGSADLETVLHKTQIDNLMFIPCGPIPPNPADLWGGERLRRFLAEAATRFDHVIIDGPPVLGFADAPLVAASVGGTLFILESRGTRRGQARGALRRLRSGYAILLGVVLTKFNARATSYGGYDYSYDYNYGNRADKTTKSRS